MSGQMKMNSPIGPLALSASERGLVQIDFMPAVEISRGKGRAAEILHIAKDQLEEYFAGARKCFDLPLDISGSAFQRKVWKALASIPYGQTRSYKELALLSGSSKAFRAVGGANGKNPLPIILPCHRVVRADGKLGGYSGGLEIKKALLDLERRELPCRV